MRIDNQGVLSMQFMMKTTDGAFVEFRVSSPSSRFSLVEVLMHNIVWLTRR